MSLPPLIGDMLCILRVSLLHSSSLDSLGGQSSSVMGGGGGGGSLREGRLGIGGATVIVGVVSLTVVSVSFGGGGVESLDDILGGIVGGAGLEGDVFKVGGA
jgi:hypothetical protein